MRVVFGCRINKGSKTIDFFCGVCYNDSVVCNFLDGSVEMDYIDLKLYISKLLKNWIIIALCSIIGVSVAFIYSKFFATPIYASSVKIGVFNSDWGTSVSVNDIETTMKLIENCIVVLEDDVMAEAIVEVVKEETGKSYSAAQVKAALSYSQMGESQYLRVQAKTTDPELSALLCNALVARAPDVLVDSVANIQIKNLGEAKVNKNPVSPNTTKNVIVGFLVALIGICFIIFLFVFFDNTVSSEEILKEKFDLSVLGVLPYTGTTPKRKGRQHRKKPRLII